MDLVSVVHVHRSELQKSEGLAQMAETLLLEENRSLGTQLDQQSDQKKNRSQEQQRCGASNDIHQSDLKGLPKWPRRSCLKKIGPLEPSLTSKATRRKIGARNNSAAALPTISISLLMVRAALCVS